MKAESADMASRVQGAPPRPRGLVAFAKWAWHSWTTRSLAVGGVATALDVLILLVCVKSFHLPNPVGAICRNSARMHPAALSSALSEMPIERHLPPLLRLAWRASGAVSASLFLWREGQRARHWRAGPAPALMTEVR